MIPLSSLPTFQLMHNAVATEIQQAEEVLASWPAQRFIFQQEGFPCEEIQEISYPEGPNTKNLFFENGNKYIGEMNPEGRPHGKGLLLYANQGSDVREIEENPFNPTYKVVNQRGVLFTTLRILKKSYQGEFKNGVPQGQGKMIFINGPLASIEGSFENGMPVGYREEIKTNGASHTFYTGQIDDFGKYQGNGWLLYGDFGHIYQGNFEAGKFQGKGKITYKTLDKSQDWGYYEGDFYDDQPHGKGFLKYSQNNPSNKLFYRGEFERNCPHGLGVLTCIEKRTGLTVEFQGLFENGRFVENTNLFNFHQLELLLSEYKQNLGEAIRICRKQDDYEVKALFIGRFDKNLSGVGAKISRDGIIEEEGIFINETLTQERKFISRSLEICC